MQLKIWAVQVLCRDKIEAFVTYLSCIFVTSSKGFLEFGGNCFPFDQKLSYKVRRGAKDQCFQKGRKCMDPIAIGGKSFLAAPRAAIDHNQPFRLLINISSTAGCKRFIFFLAVKYSKNARPFVSFQVNKIFGQRCLRIYKQSKLLLILNGNHKADKIFLFVT